LTENTLFRAQAVAALDDPDRLGTALRLVPMPHRFALAGIILLILGAMLGAALIRVPILVTAPGIFLGPSGTLGATVTCQYEGRVVSVGVQPGEHVTAGDTIATLINPGLLNERLLATQELAQTQAQLDRVRQIQQETQTAFQALQARQEADIAESLQFLNDRLKTLGSMAANNDALKRNGLVTADRVLQIQTDVAAAREQLSNKRTALFTAQVDALDRAGKYERELQQLQDHLNDVERKLAALSDKLAKTSFVTSNVTGTVEEVSIDVGDLVRFGTAAVTVEPDAADKDAGLTAGLLVPLNDGKKIRPGMKAMVDVSAIRKDVYGAVEARVRSIAAVPTTPEGIRRVLRNDDLVRKLTAAGPGYLAVVALDRDPKTPSGYRWTSSRGPDAALTVGTTVQADIESERVSVLSLLLPAIKGLLNGPAPEGAPQW
jgi:HlyD family secretion protein